MKTKKVFPIKATIAIVNEVVNDWIRKANERS